MSPPAFALVLAAAFSALPAGAEPRLRCEISQGGQTRVLEFAPVADPYSVEAVDIDGRFRFKAVLAGDRQKVDYVKVYAYYDGPRQPVLLHQATYPAPAAAADAMPNSLTGINRIYSPRLGRELQYGCALLERAP